MRTTVLAIVLASGMALGAQTTPAPHQVQQVTSGHSVPTTVARPIIKDPAEYDAYVDAVLQTDPVGRMGSLQAFLQQYPDSVVKPDVLRLISATKKIMERSSKSAR